MTSVVPYWSMVVHGAYKLSLSFAYTNHSLSHVWSIYIQLFVISYCVDMLNGSNVDFEEIRPICRIRMKTDLLKDLSVKFI